ncbi:integrase core domain-containing protein, partial [Thermoactinomyces mirandus]|uniref:integrase core domain-containing protein n=1 Tax=Thermoactinomyces mirandus TaxID=2756294 RepID=UPI001C68C470
MLAQFGLRPSMSRRGNCLDNAPIESFFSHLKTETLQYHHIQDAEQAQILIQQYNHFYNEERLQLKLNKLAPVRIQASACSIIRVFFCVYFFGA